MARGLVAPALAPPVAMALTPLLPVARLALSTSSIARSPAMSFLSVPLVLSPLPSVLSLSLVTRLPLPVPLVMSVVRGAMGLGCMRRD
mmetsp:Transcript_4741/g.11574  ORF Transcript_4741/g.11574 Transcript_4741/m.11574 type:complete len:88 (+) Transcript_4741:536-799(+)